VQQQQQQDDLGPGEGEGRVGHLARLLVALRALGGGRGGSAGGCALGCALGRGLARCCSSTQLLLGWRR
jgi:hypothetical protein